jgi:predicted heme/steroid binding protein
MYFYKTKRKFRVKPIFYSLFFALILVAGSAFALRGLGFLKKTDSARSGQSGRLPVMKSSELKAFDGTKPGKPIYLGYEGLVYDVTAGKDYYQAGGTYHFLAGKDSTADLRLAGGDIIKRKYPVVAQLAQ